jgi:hypothetical protein
MKKTLLFLLLIFFFLPSFLVVEAATFSFDKSSYSVGVGQTVQVQVNIDTGGEQINGADAYINYDNSFLSVENITAGSFFPTVTNETGTAGRIYIAAFVDDPASSKTGSGTLATITFKGLKDGTANLSFDCNNSKIVKSDANATNILQCSSDYKAAISVGSGSGGSSSISSSNSSSSSDESNSSNNNQPQTLPKSGIFENLINFAIPGAILFLIGGGLKLFILK